MRVAMQEAFNRYVSVNNVFTVLTLGYVQGVCV